MARREPFDVTLRRTTEGDLPTLHGFEVDPASNELAGTKPRDWPTFRARWAEILADGDGSAVDETRRRRTSHAHPGECARWPMKRSIARISPACSGVVSVNASPTAVYSADVAP